MSKKVKVTIQLTEDNANVLNKLKETLGASDGRTGASSIIMNMIFVRLREQILSMFDAGDIPIQKRRVEPTCTNDSFRSDRSEVYTSTDRLPPINL